MPLPVVQPFKQVKRILIAVTLSELGGAQSYVKWLALHLPKEQFEVAVACAGQGELVRELAQAGIPVFVQPHLRRELSPLDDIRAIIDLYRLIRKLRPDLVHLNSSKAGIIGRVAAALAGAPCVFTAHGWAFAEGIPAFRRQIALWSERLVTPLTKHIICVSAYDLDLARRYQLGRVEQLSLIHNGLLDNAPLSNVSSMSPSGLARVVMVARFAPPKQYDKVIQAFRAVQGAELRLIGEGPLLDQSRQLVKSLGLEHKVHFLGNRHDVSEILAQAHIFVLSSAWEGLPISILEAMRAGLPIVASATGGILEMVRPGLNGFIGPKEEYTWISEAIQSLVNDVNLRMEMSQASRHIFMEEFTFEKVLAKTIQIYNSVLFVGAT